MKRINDMAACPGKTDNMDMGGSHIMIHPPISGRQWNQLPPVPQNSVTPLRTLTNEVSDATPALQRCSSVASRYSGEGCQYNSV